MRSRNITVGQCRDSLRTALTTTAHTIVALITTTTTMADTQRHAITTITTGTMTTIIAK
jgi:hypothetical protein